jgi:hypothetical protein
MEVILKIREITKIISLIPQRFHATGLTVKLTGSNKPTDVRIYFAERKNDLENQNFRNSPYIQFKADHDKPKNGFKPVYNSLDKAYDYCFIETDKPLAIASEVLLYYEGL